MPPRTWNDDDLRRAITSATSWSDVIRELGLRESGSARPQLRRAAARAGVGYEHLERGDRRTWADPELAAAVAAGRNLAQVFRLLGLTVGGQSWVAMLEHIERLSLDTSHWDAGAVRPGRTKPPLPAWSDDEVRVAAESARSVGEVMRRLGLDPGRKRGRAAVVRRLEQLGIDHRSWPGQAWAAGRRGGGGPRARPLEEILVRGSTMTSSQLRQRLIDEGVFAARCSGCERSSWRGGPMPLQLDHIDGDRRNNELPNLRLLCPNCHALTDTYCGRNIGRV